MSQQAVAAKQTEDTSALIAHMQAEILAEMNRVVGRMQRFDTQTDEYLAKF